MISHYKIILILGVTLVFQNQSSAENVIRPMKNKRIANLEKSQL